MIAISVNQQQEQKQQQQQQQQQQQYNNTILYNNNLARETRNLFVYCLQHDFKFMLELKHFNLEL